MRLEVIPFGTLSQYCSYLHAVKEINMGCQWNKWKELNNDQGTSPVLGSRYILGQEISYHGWSHKIMALSLYLSKTNGHTSTSSTLLATNVMALITHMKKAVLQVLIIDTPPTHIKGNKHLVGLTLCTLQKPWKSNWKESHRPPISIIAFLIGENLSLGRGMYESIVLIRVDPGLYPISPDYHSGKISHMTRVFPIFPYNVGDGYLNVSVIQTSVYGICSLCLEDNRVNILRLKEPHCFP